MVYLYFLGFIASFIFSMVYMLREHAKGMLWDGAYLLDIAFVAFVTAMLWPVAFSALGFAILRRKLMKR